MMNNEEPTSRIGLTITSCINIHSSDCSGDFYLAPGSNEFTQIYIYLCIGVKYALINLISPSFLLASLRKTRNDGFLSLITFGQRHQLSIL